MTFSRFNTELFEMLKALSNGAAFLIVCGSYLGWMAGSYLGAHVDSLKEVIRFREVMMPTPTDIAQIEIPVYGDALSGYWWAITEAAWNGLIFGMNNPTLTGSVWYRYGTMAVFFGMMMAYIVHIFGWDTVKAGIGPGVGVVR